MTIFQLIKSAVGKHDIQFQDSSRLRNCGVKHVRFDEFDVVGHAEVHPSLSHRQKLEATISIVIVLEMHSSSDSKASLISDKLERASIERFLFTNVYCVTRLKGTVMCAPYLTF